MHVVPMAEADLTDDREEAEADVLARVGFGDPAAITKIYEQHHRAVRAFAQRLLGDPEAAEDLLQDVFVALPAAIRRFRGDCALRTYLILVAVNHAKNHVRAAVRRRAAVARLGREPLGTVTTPEQELSRRDLARRLMQALDALPFEQRVVVVLSEIEERTSAEIGAILGVPEGTVRTRLFHAKRKLRELLGEAEESGEGAQS